MNVKIITLFALAALTVSTLAASDISTNDEISNPPFSAIISQTSAGVLYHGDSTNGLGCNLEVTTGRFEQGQSIPTCLVYVYNQTTNNFHFINLLRETLFNIELLDSSGKPVERTPVGQAYKTWWTEKQINDWIHAEIRKGGTDRMFWSVWSNDSTQHGYFGIPELFKVKVAGEYTLNFKMRLMRNTQDSTGVHQITTWLPEVIAKVQIRPEDVPLENLPASSIHFSPIISQTNK